MFILQKTILVLAIAALLLTASTGYAIYTPQMQWDVAAGGQSIYYGQGMTYDGLALFGKISYGPLAYDSDNTNTPDGNPYEADNYLDTTSYGHASYYTAKSVVPLGDYMYATGTDAKGIYQFDPTDPWSNPVPLDGNDEIVFQAAAQAPECIVSDGTYLYGTSDVSQQNLHRWSISGASATGFTATVDWTLSLPPGTNTTARIRGFTYNSHFDELYAGDHNNAGIYKVINPGSTTGTQSLVKIGDNTDPDADGEYQVARYGSGNELYVVGESYESTNADLVIYQLDSVTGMIIPGQEQEIDLGMGNTYGIVLEGNGRDAMGMWVTSLGAHVSYWELRHGGDADEDGNVDVTDLGLLATNYGLSGKVWADGDYNGDGNVDVSDLGILATEYGWSAEVAAVPEPSTLILLGFGVSSLLLWRRRFA